MRQESTSSALETTKRAGIGESGVTTRAAAGPSTTNTPSIRRQWPETVSIASRSSSGSSSSRNSVRNKSNDNSFEPGIPSTYSVSKPGREVAIRPGTASTVESYSSAMPFSSDDSAHSPRKASIKARTSSSSSTSRRGPETKDRFEEMLASGETRLKSETADVAKSGDARASQEGGRVGGKREAAIESNQLNRETTKRNLDATIAEERENESKESESREEEGEEGSMTPTPGLISQSVNPTQKLSRPHKSTERGPSSPSSGISNNSMGYPFGLPVHPHHRVSDVGESEEGQEKQSNSQRSDRSRAYSLRAQKAMPAMPARALASPTPAATPPTLVTPSSSTSRSRSRTSEAPSPSSFSNFSQSTFTTTFGRKADLPAPPLQPRMAEGDAMDGLSGSEKFGNGLKDRLKKTSGFLKRLGGGGSVEKNRALNVPRTPKVVRKASQSSFASEGGASIANSAKSAPSEYQSRWINQEAGPVPSIPSKYKEDAKSPSKSEKEKARREARGLTNSESSERDHDSPSKVHHQRGTTSSAGGSTDSASTGMRHALLAWGNEMDATLKQSGQDIEAKTKIEKPMAQWSSSPRLPEYKLNGKSSFMDDEGERGRETESTEMLNDTFDQFSTAKSKFATRGKEKGKGGGGADVVKSFDSLFLSPQVTQRSASLGIGLPSSVSPSSTLIHSDPISSTPTFSSSPHHEATEDSYLFRRSRGINSSNATAMSFETAIDRPSFFLRHEPDGAGKVGEEGERKGETEEEGEDEMDPEKSIRLITTASSDSGLESDYHPALIPTDLSTLSHTAKHAKDRTLTPADAVHSRSASPAREEKGSNGVDEAGDCEALAKELAKRCFNEDESFKKKEKLAEWLGGTGLVNRLARRHYMDHFEFAGLRIDAAFRKLCDRLFLRAETQQVDRILSAFSQRYYDSNPQSRGILLNSDVVHGLVFSLVLLNTDLHVADIQDRMTRTQFVRNTLAAIMENSEASAGSQTWTNLPSVRSEEGRKSQSSLDVSGDALPSDSTSAAGGGSSSAHRAGIPDGVQSNAGSDRQAFSRAWEVEMEAMLKDVYGAIKTDQIRLPIAADSNTLMPAHPPKMQRMGSDRVNALKRGSIRGIQGLLGASNGNLRSDENLNMSRTSLSSTQRSFSDNHAHSTPSTSMVSASSNGYPVSSLPLTLGFANTLSKSIIKEAKNEDDSESIDSANDDFTDDELALMGPPWAKEGMLTRKHYWELPLKRAKDKNWVDCFVVVQKGMFSMFKFGNSATSSAPGGAGVGGGNWLSNATCIGEFSLAHTLANSLPPPGYNRSRPHVFALTLSNGSVYFFQTGHEELVQEWVSTCNYWAARQSREPLGGGVSNMEYGWNHVMPSDHLDDDDGAVLPSESISQRMDMYKSSASNVTHNSSDVHSIRSGKSGKSLRMRAATTKSMFQGWQQATNGERTLSSPVPGSSSRRPSSSLQASERPLFINEWRTPAPSTVNSTLSEEDQLEACKRHKARVEAELTEHSALRQPMIQYLDSINGGQATLAKALANFDRKSSYLLSDLTKFTLYTATLTSANRLKAEKRDARQLNNMMLKADEELSRVKEEEEGPPIRT